jgi:hypothetical protein
MRMYHTYLPKEDFGKGISFGKRMGSGKRADPRTCEVSIWVCMYLRMAQCEDLVYCGWTVRSREVNGMIPQSMMFFVYQKNERSELEECIGIMMMILTSTTSRLVLSLTI